MIHVLRRLLIEPDEILAGALKLFPSLRAIFESDRRYSAVHAFDLNVIDDAALRVDRLAFPHPDSADPFRIDIAHQLLLRHIALHLRRQAHHPSVHRPGRLPIRMRPPRQPYAFRRARLGLARAVTAQRPPVFLRAPMKHQLLFVRPVIQELLLPLSALKLVHQKLRLIQKLALLSAQMRPSFLTPTSLPKRTRVCICTSLPKYKHVFFLYFPFRTFWQICTSFAVQTFRCTNPILSSCRNLLPHPPRGGRSSSRNPRRARLHSYPHFPRPIPGEAARQGLEAPRGSVLRG